GYKESTGAAQIVDVAIDLPAGATVTGWTARVYGNDVDDLTHKLVSITDGVETDVDSATLEALGASWQTATKVITPIVVNFGTRLVIRFWAGGSGQRVAAPAVRWTYPKP